MKYWGLDTEPDQSNPYCRNIIICVLFIGLLCWFGIGNVSAEDKKSNSIDTGPDVAIIDASVKMDISDMGEITLGTIPDETLIVTITVQNIGNREAPGYKLRTYLVRVGREDEIGTQIGGDITDTRLGAGETRTYTKNWALPEHLKKGEYRVMVALDTSNYFIEPDTDNNRIIGEQSIFPGSLSGPEGSIPVYSPAEITKPGYYILKRDIDGSKDIDIFTIKSSGVTFDGGGNTIRGISTGFSTGIYVYAGVAMRDIVIKNLVIEGVDTGIWMYKVSNGKIIGSTFRNNKNMGIRLDQSNQNEITGNAIEQNGMGIGIFESKDNHIYNNVFKNTHNAAVNDNFQNQWNTNLTSGTNIIGGSIIGGNAWFDESGEGGFSATAQDYSHDGISDNPYSINAKNIDLYPLAKGSSKPAPVEERPQASDTDIQNTSTDAGNTTEIGAETITQDTDAEPTAETESQPVETISVPDNTSSLAVESISPSEGPISPYADISVKEVTGPSSSCPGTEFTISAVIQNAGGYDADSFQVRFYLSEDKEITSKDIFLGEETIKDLKAGSEQELSEIYTISDKVGLNNYYLAIATNTNNSLFENKKENNFGYSSERMIIRKC